MSVSRRDFLTGSAALGGALLLRSPSYANAAADAYFRGYAEDNGFRYRLTNFKKIDPVWQRQVVKYFSTESPGTVVVDSTNHFLYVVYENNTALRYGVGVGKEGFQWFGRARIDRKAIWPQWVPPPEMLQRRPDLPRRVEGGAANNPLGPRAMYLYRDGADLGYRLHGTLEPWSIGRDVSSGCIRMFPEDVIDLYQRCPKGTRVLVLEHLGEKNAG
ncbi:L,D-transpeptidase family protein [Roseibium aggregatum]|uniref:L,D-transpeptidase family protein n=1 Tax=Roseibium aggregatum TaxID=187304 RepID=A0A926S876_9HYPH|nr:L,D-transpeptidase family protein [Roseibium aggregatum]MBD1548377.1 L,D-transpeptidase family protein [Roseibium aggregatum]